jgi:transcription antitermination factor NusG
MFVMAFWAAAQLQPRRDQLALHCLKLFGFETYAPRLRDQRTIRGSKVIKTPLLFPGYVFVLIHLQWSRARWSPGVVRLVMDGITPAVVPDTVVTSLKAREVNGLIELPSPPRFQRGDRVRVLHGPLAGQVGLFAGMKPRERVAVLLTLLGSSRRVELAGSAVERVRPDPMVGPRRRK